MRSSSRRIVLILSVASVVTGCASAALPAKPTRAELARLETAHFPLTVAVRPSVNPDHSERLIKALRRTGLFDRVDSVSALPNANLLAVVDSRAGGSAVIPLFTIVSLGLYPTSVEEEWGDSFYLWRYGEPSERVRVDSTYRGTTTLGWWALVKSLLPNHAFIDPERTRRYQHTLSFAIVSSIERSDLRIENE